VRTIYAFCFAPASLDVSSAADLGLGDCGWDEPISIAPTAGLRAVLSYCPAERFAGAEAEERLADLQWLLPRVEAHDRVIARTMAAATVFPLPFGTLFSTSSALAMEVARRRHTLLDFFDRMEGREEWAVKALLDNKRAIAARTRQIFPGAADAPVGGRGYLLQQRQRVEAERAIGPWLSEVIMDLDQHLRRHCETVVTRPARDPAVANWACLAAPGGRMALREAVASIAPLYLEDGLELHCSGPWPLYSFCGAP
jgi:hypothetical protein